MALSKFSPEINHHLLEILHFSDTESGCVLLEEGLFMFNLVLLLMTF